MITYEVKVQEKTVNHHASETWLLDGKMHREGDLPAYTYSGDNYWYKHGKLHRTNGPAIVRVDGHREWYLDDESFTEDQHTDMLNPHKELTIAEIEKKLGYKIKVVK